MQSQLPPIFYIVFTGITCFGVLLQAFVLFGMYLAIRRLANRMHGITDEIRPHLVPIVATTRKLVEESAPKVKVAVNDMVEVTHKMRTQTDNVTATVDELLTKANAQANRVDEIVTAGIDSAAHATHAVRHAVSVPVRQASALFAGLKAGFDVLRGRNHSERPPEEEYYE